MPVFKCPPKSEPLWKGWDQKAQKNGLRHQVYAVNGDHYVGEWKDNTKHGKGTQVWKKNGAIYEGDWKFGKRDGYGTLSLPEKGSRKYQRVYSGWWKEDKKSGYGVQFFGPKEFYEGEWCSNQRCGWGRMYYSNGDIYEGQWWKDKPDGEGMLRLSECSAPAGPAPKLGPPHLLTTPQRWLRLTPASHAQCPVATPLTPCWPLAAPLSGIRA
ncbi:MORN repeat-containing protein 3 [Marmota marmota marmota]|uniref:MORN repeat-containing protein 3 n=1 Tax=Marmota marmota marmota TaxID=9994 RepID=UPI000762B1CD|nr:MORN repeat-containing protein 3 [Marmota marmota marmota]XP_048641525.1 MORN repeat-containing protein 3 [Marmota marmota marmota]XP_048641526.1 MORN repeat-containing protein 3 [Marmota marmota marmota]